MLPRSWQLASVRLQPSSLRAQEALWQLPHPPPPNHPPDPASPERLQRGGRVRQAAAQGPHAGVAQVIVAHHELLELPLGPEHRGQGLAAGGRQVAVLHPGGRRAVIPAPGAVWSRRVPQSPPCPRRHPGPPRHHPLTSSAAPSSASRGLHVGLPSSASCLCGARLPAHCARLPQTQVKGTGQLPAPSRGNVTKEEHLQAPESPLLQHSLQPLCQQGTCPRDRRVQGWGRARRTHCSLSMWHWGSRRPSHRSCRPASPNGLLLRYSSRRVGTERSAPGRTPQPASVRPQFWTLWEQHAAVTGAPRSPALRTGSRGHPQRAGGPQMRLRHEEAGSPHLDPHWVAGLELT